MKVEEHYESLKKIIADATKRTPRKDKFHGWESKLSLEEKGTLNVKREKVVYLERCFADSRDTGIFEELVVCHADLRETTILLKGKVADALIEVNY